MNILHKLKSFFIDDLKKDVANLIAVAVFIDSIVRPQEVKKGFEVLENLFDGEDYEFLTEEVEILLESFQADAISFIDAKKEAIVFMKNNKKIRKDLIEIIKLIFKSDHEVHAKEQELIEKIEKLENIEGEL